MSKKETPESKNSSIGNIIGSTESFIEKNQKGIIIVFSVIIFVVLALFLINKFYLKPKEARASEELFPAQNYFAMDSLDKALKGDGKNMGFIDIADEYSSTKSGNLAKYYSGICLLKKGNFEEAITYLENYSAKDILTDVLSKAAIGDAYLELGNTDDAIKNYVKASKIDNNEMTTPYVLIKLGHAYEIKGDFSNAVTTYKKIKNEFPSSSEARDIDKYIAYAETLIK